MKCCICGKTFRGFGNNPDPIKDVDGQLLDEKLRCCDACDVNFVIPYRLAQLTNHQHELRRIQNKVNLLRGRDTRRIRVVVERPDGSSFDQLIENVGEFEKSLEKYEKTIGEDLHICDAWYED